MKIKYDNGQPCNHKGCLHHTSHPCEGCGRIGGEGIVCEFDNEEISIISPEKDKIIKIIGVE